MEHRNKLRRLWCSGESPLYVYRQPNCHCQVTLPFCSMKSVWFKEESFELQSLLLLCLLGTKQRKTKISPCLCSILHLHKRKWRQHWKIYINRPENYFALFLSMKIFSFLFLSLKIKPTWLSIYHPLQYRPYPVGVHSYSVSAELAVRVQRESQNKKCCQKWRQDRGLVKALYCESDLVRKNQKNVQETPYFQSHWQFYDGVRRDSI